MAGASKPIFREKSLERLSTPDRLDQLLRIVKRRTWIPLLALGGLLAVVIAWCFLGRVPITADATAVLVYPRTVVPLQAEASGELRTLKIEVGMVVEKDQVIATIVRNDLVDEIELQRERLRLFQDRRGRLTDFSEKQVKEEKDLLEKQRARLTGRIQAVETLAEEVRAQTDDYNDEQRTNLEAARDHSIALDDALHDRLESYKRLLDEGLTSEDKLIDARQRWVTNQLALADIEVRLQELALRVIKAAAVYDGQMDVVADLRLQLEQVGLREHAVDKQLKEAEIHRQTDEEEIQRTITRLGDTLERKSSIVADSDGTVLEITVSPGSMVTAGQRIASMAKDDPDKTLRALAYFDIADGKKIRKLMHARISPVTVQPQRHGSILGDVLKVSEYPVTADAVVNQVGNREMAKMLVGDQSRIEVIATLQPDPDTVSGFHWTSAGGPDFEITPGTTARVRVTLEERAPITLLIPALQGWLGLD